MVSARTSLRSVGFLALVALTVSVPLISPTPAQASGYYDVVFVENPTNYTITYSIRYGDGAWSQRTIYPGGVTRWSAPSTGDVFYIAFSADIGNGGGTREYRLTPDHTYYFSVRNYQMDILRRP
jgi:hypothetical protein